MGIENSRVTYYDWTKHLYTNVYCPTCTDGLWNGDEEEIDCGGPDCDACPTCSDGLLNGDEEDIDCGGPGCDACPTCSDGLLNGDEEDIDCGGSDCDECVYCDDGLWNGDEDGVDCGGTKGCNACHTISFNSKNVLKTITAAHMDSFASEISATVGYI